MFLNSNQLIETTTCKHCHVNYQRTHARTDSGVVRSLLCDIIEWNPDGKILEHPSFFWRTHTISVLMLVTTGLCYVALFEKQVIDSDYNVKRGVIASFAVFIAFGVTQARDGPFVRPHPVFWRFILCCSVIYELVLIFLLFQTASDARKWMAYFDPELGKNLPEHDYGGNCLLYDPAVPSDPFHNIWDKMDVFVIGHLLGWMVKTMVLRDYWITMSLSFFFEIFEYSLQHQLPNFSECWWDHWLLDFVFCNGLGIYLGMLTCNFLEMKHYEWRNMWSIDGYSKKLLRVLQQFTPFDWKPFAWGTTLSLKRWLATLFIMLMFTLAELNVFYMKAALWIPPPHYTLFVRLALFAAMGSVAIRECFDFLYDPNCKRFGQQAWVIAAIIITEILICWRFLWDTMTKVPPFHIILFWSCMSVLIVGYTLWLFIRDFLLYQSLETPSDTDLLDSKVKED